MVCLRVSFILNLEWKALKIKLKSVFLPASRGAVRPLFKENFGEREKT